MMRSLPGGAWPVIVFVLAFVVMAFLTPQFVAELDPPTGDEPFYLQMAISLLHDHDFEMTNNYAQRDYLDFYPKETTGPPFQGWESAPMDLPPHQSATLRPGLYEKHGIGVPILVAPAYQLGGRLGTVFFMNLLAALLAANTFLLAREFSGSLRWSLMVTLGLAFTSPLLPYAFLIFPAIPAALLAVYSFRRSRLSPSNGRWQLAGLASSLAFLPWLHAGYLLLSVPIFCYFLVRNWRNLRALAWVASPSAVSAGLLMFYYYYLYGTIMPNVGDHAGFSSPLGALQGAAGLFLDQQWGLVTYSPFYLAAVAGIFLMWRLQRREAAWLSLSTVPVFLFFASYNQWWGEWGPPARYLVPILPFAAAPAALVLREARSTGKILSIVLLGLSLFLMGAFVAAPKLMYNQPTGESELFLAFARGWGFDLTTWLPSFVVPGNGIVWQAALAMAVGAVLTWSILDSSAPGRAPAGPSRILARISPEWRRRLSPVLTIVAVGLVLATGAWFRLTGVDWDSGQHLHPDERFITMVATDTKLPSSLGEYFDSARSPLNPNNRNFPSYPYGTSFLFLAKLLAGPTGLQGYEGLVILGRYLSALADLGAVLLVFFLGRRLYNRWVGILGSFLYATAVLPIQHSHFFVSESFTTFFVVLTFFLAVRVSRGGLAFRTIPKPTHGGVMVRLRRFIEFRGTPPETPGGGSGPLHPGGEVPERSAAMTGTPPETPRGSGALSPAEKGLERFDTLTGTPLETPGGGSSPVHPNEGTWLGGWAGYLLMGAACGLALASKISVAILIPVMGVATLMAYWKGRGVRQFAGLGLALVAMFLAFRIVQPYAFAGSGFFDLRPSPFFWGSVEEQRRMAEGSLDYPYTLQYAGTIPYLFPLVNLLWGLGPALLVSASGGFVLALYQLWTRRRPEHLLVALWVGLAFVYFGGQFVKYMRYLLPIYPFLALLAGFTLWWLVKAIGGALPRGRPRLWFQGLCLLVVLGGTFLWAFAYTRIYTQPLTRVEASSWIYQNVPAGSTVGVEHWDDPLPLNLKDRAAQQYRQITLELYNDDNPAKRDRLVDQLSNLDYIFLSSNRLYGSIPRLPLRYPMTIEYYRRLFSGELGFEQAAVFTSYPTLGPWQLVDDRADESFTVYDHPKVLIFKKVPGFSRDRARELLSAVSLENVVRQGQKDASSAGLLMSPDLLQANLTGGTWTQIFDPQGLPARLPFLSWYLLVQVLSLATLPLGLLALGRLPDRGYPLLKTLGVLLVAYLSWLAASLRLASYSRLTILCALLAVSGLSALALWRWGDVVKKSLRDNWRVILATEVIFLSAFLAFYLIRLSNPDLWHPYRGGEKPMDLAFLNAVVKSTYFPPYDPWFSGGYINYYYFGQVLVATLTKLTAIPTAVAFNLAVPLFFALTVLGAFSAGFNLVGMGRRRITFRWALAGGLGAALFVGVIGNLDGLFQLVQGLWSLTHQSIDTTWPGVAGLLDAWAGLGERLAGKPLPPFDFWRSSRLMSPAISITEFPFFTFLFADLHAHLVGLPFTLLALGSILSLAQGWARQWLGRAAQIFIAALCLGALWVINSWDFPIYIMLAAVVLLLLGMRRPFSWSPLIRNLLLGAGLFLASYILYYPFHYYYQQFYAGVNPSPEKTPLLQYLGVHGLFILIIGAYLLTRLRDGVKRFPGGSSLLAVAGVWLFGLIVALLLITQPTAAFLVFLMTLSSLALAAARDRASMVAAVLILAALALGLGVEFVTIKGDIQRMNSVFKFYLQAWVLMGVASGYCLTVLARTWSQGRRPWLAYVWLPLVAIALWGTLLYPIAATPIRVADRFVQLPPADDGMAYMREATYNDEKGPLDLSLDYRAVTWMQQNIQGSPVVLEGGTPLYRWGSRISILTGLPTVIGWDNHEKQQRVAYSALVDTRLADVNIMYSTSDGSTVLRLLRKYGVSYVYVGQLERNYYPAGGIAKFDSMEDAGQLLRVYQDGPVRIYQVVEAAGG